MIAKLRALPYITAGSRVFGNESIQMGFDDIKLNLKVIQE